jgi:hypothetical protein
LKVKVLPVSMASGADVEPALAAIARARPEALVVLPAPISIANGLTIPQALLTRADEVVQ